MTIAAADVRGGTAPTAVEGSTHGATRALARRKRVVRRASPRLNVDAWR